MEKAREFQKNIYSTSASLIMQKPLTVWTTTMGVPDHLTYLLRNYTWDRKQQLELDMEQLIGSKLGKEYEKAVYCLHAYLNYMQNTS